jgi:polycystin 1L2
MRQIRVKPNSCRVDKRVRNVTQECAQGTMMINEDERDYCNGWEESTALTKNLPSCKRQEFKYTEGVVLDSLPYTANVDSYGGGGYVYRLNRPSKQTREELKLLQMQQWVNNHTRAIFLEFSVYNTNVSDNNDLPVSHTIFVETSGT